MQNTIALNTELPDNVPEWVELIPAGQRVKGRDGRWWVNDRPDDIITAFAQNGADLPFDVEHSTEIKAKNGDAAPAIAWVKALEVRDGGAIWGQVAWNAEGKDLVAKQGYRYVSPVFVFERNSRRITSLDSVGLTNKPNLHLTALNRRDDSMDNTMPEQISLAVCTALGLSSNATDAQVVEAITALKSDRDTAMNRADAPSLDKFVPREDHDKAVERATNAEQKLTEIETAQQAEKIEAAINGALDKGVITPATADYHRACCKQEGGLAQFAKFVESAPKVADPALMPERKPAANGALSDEDRAACSMLGLSEEDFTKAKEAA